jgi:hypothetical protein
MGRGSKAGCYRCHTFQSLGSNGFCASCNNSRSREYYRKNPEKKLLHCNRSRRLLREKAHRILGDKCIHCGIRDYRCMQIDHINDDGYRDSLDTAGICRKIIKGDKEGYQLLCANCNWIKLYNSKSYWKRRGHGKEEQGTD